MPGTYSQIYLQYVFAVKGRQNLLLKEFREDVFKYISGIITAKNQKSIIVGGVADHVHILVGLRPSMNVSDLIRDVKNNSTNFINEQKFLNEKFAWQEGYGVFSYSRSQIDSVYKYIANQEQHHKTATFKEEYLSLLREFEIEYDQRFLFDFGF